VNRVDHQLSRTDDDFVVVDEQEGYEEGKEEEKDEEELERLRVF